MTLSEKKKKKKKKKPNGRLKILSYLLTFLKNQWKKNVGIDEMFPEGENVWVFKFFVCSLVK